jgi:anthranilate synthase component 1
LTPSADTLIPARDIAPGYDAFTATYDAGRPQVVWTRLVADLETPVSAYLKIADKMPMSFLLESVEGGSSRGRYSVIGLNPDLIWRATGNKAEINRAPMTNPGAFEGETVPALTSLRKLLAESRIDLPEGLPPMAAGTFGYMGYDTVRLIEKLPEMGPDALGVPDAILIRPTLMVVFDSVKDEMTVVTPVRPQKGVSAKDAFAAADARLSAAVASLDAPLPHQTSAWSPRRRSTSSPATSSRSCCRSASRADFTAAPFDLYRALRHVNPSPFLFCLDFGRVRPRRQFARDAWCACDRGR